VVLCLDLEYNEDAAIEIYNEAGGKSTDQLDYCSLIKLIESWSTHEHVDLSQSLQSNFQKEKKIQEETKQQQLHEEQATTKPLEQQIPETNKVSVQNPRIKLRVEKEDLPQGNRSVKVPK